MENQFIQFKHKFINDASILLDDLESDLLKYESNPDDEALTDNIFRCMHSLKGVSSLYGYENITKLTHHLESVFELVRDKKISLNYLLIQITFATIDYIRNELQDDVNECDKNFELFNKLMTSINGIIQKSGYSLTDLTQKPEKCPKNESGEYPATWLIVFKPNEHLITRNINLIRTFDDLFKLGRCRIERKDTEETFLIYLFTEKKLPEIEDVLLFILEDCKIIKIAEFDIFEKSDFEKFENKIEKLKKAESNYNGENAITEDSFVNQTDTVSSGILKNRINVDSSKLDELMYLVSELITTNSQINLAAKDRTYNPIRPYLEKIDKLSKLFRNNSLNLRLVPVNEMLIRFQRLVRDLSTLLGKEVELISQGTETELDKSTIDALADPMMHIIRNCIDHGIESPDIRQNRNKPRKGIIKIAAFHSGNFVFIQIQDDGNGIDKEKVHKKAIEKGIISHDAQLTEKELYDLIFLPGFSTAENLTQVSGRGVGMDVVKKRIAELRGQVEITSETGLGTSFTIKLHQTIAILDTLLFQIDDMYMLVPISDVEKCSLVETKKLKDHFGSVSYNNRLITYIDLYNAFNLKTPEKKQSKLIIINRQEKIFAIAVDRIVGEHQAVLKSLGNHLKHQNKIAGASILGDGHLAYLLDLTAIQYCNN